MNNNNNNVSGMVNDTLLVVSLKSVVRDIVREELMLQGIPVDNNVQRMVTRQQFDNMQKPNTNYDTRTGGVLNKPNNTQFDFKINRPLYENRIDNEYYSSNEFGPHPDSEFHPREFCTKMGDCECWTCSRNGYCTLKLNQFEFDCNKFMHRYFWQWNFEHVDRKKEFMCFYEVIGTPEVHNYIKFNFNGNNDAAIKLAFMDLSDRQNPVCITDDDEYLKIPREDLKIVCVNVNESRQLVLYCDITDNINKDNINTIADVKAKKYEAFRKLGFFDLMPNGFNLYLDDEDIVEDDDSAQALLDYNLNDDCYTLISNSAIKITRDDLLKCTITSIGSDIFDFSVPAVWIKPDENWYKKRELYSGLTSALINVTNKKYATEKALMKTDAVDTAKPKSRRKSTK